MSTRTPISNPWPSKRRTAFFLANLLLVIIASCVPASTQEPVQPSPSAIEPSATPIAIEPSPTAPPPTATGEALIPAGWMTHPSPRCEYALSYPADMQVSYEGPYSRTFGFKPANPDDRIPNFVYASVLIQEFQIQILGGETIYNYDPTEAEILLNMEVGESKDVREGLNVTGFTYERKPDTTIGGHAAQTYENVQPWEFPEGTKEIRYYLSLNGCTYLIGGYLDTMGSNQPGAITEDLFHQIIATVQLMP